MQPMINNHLMVVKLFVMRWQRPMAVPQSNPFMEHAIKMLARPSSDVR
jgi:hypothetical protein